MAEIVKENNYQNIVNIGVYQGASIFPMAEICNGKIHCVDIWPIEEWKAAFVAGIKARKLTNCIVHQKLNSSPKLLFYQQEYHAQIW